MITVFKLRLGFGYKLKLKIPMTKRTILQIVLAVVIVGLIIVLTMQIMNPLRFDKERKTRETVVIERIKDIRSAQRAYKQQYNEYSTNFNDLIRFVLNDSLTYERTFGSADDSVAVAQGLVRTEKFKKAAIDTIFGTRILTPEAVRELRYIPFSELSDGERKEYVMDATILETESKVKVPVFEAKAPYKDFLGDLNKQLLINLIDEQKNVLRKYPGIKVGSLEVATNDAGNWE